MFVKRLSELLSFVIILNLMLAGYVNPGKLRGNLATATAKELGPYTESFHHA